MEYQDQIDDQAYRLLITDTIQSVKTKRYKAMHTKTTSTPQNTENIDAARKHRKNKILTPQENTENIDAAKHGNLDAARKHRNKRKSRTIHLVSHLPKKLKNPSRRP